MGASRRDRPTAQPAGAHVVAVGQGAAAAGDELMGDVGQVVGVGGDPRGDRLGTDEDPLQNSLARVIREALDSP